MNGPQSRSHSGDLNRKANRKANRNCVSSVNEAINIIVARNISTLWQMHELRIGLSSGMAQPSGGGVPHASSRDTTHCDAMVGSNYAVCNVAGPVVHTIKFRFVSLPIRFGY